MTLITRHLVRFRCDILLFPSLFLFFFFQAEDGIRDLVRSRGLGDVYKRQDPAASARSASLVNTVPVTRPAIAVAPTALRPFLILSLIHI